MDFKANLGYKVTPNLIKQNEVCYPPPPQKTPVIENRIVILDRLSCAYGRDGEFYADKKLKYTRN